MTKKLSKASEAQILTAIQDVVDLVSDGSSPTEAVTKVASDQRLPENFVKLVCVGYNTGATNHQRESHSSVLNKYADFPLADFEQVRRQLWPKSVLTPAQEKVASAVSYEYGQPPRPLAPQASGMCKAAELDITALLAKERGDTVEESQSPPEKSAAQQLSDCRRAVEEKRSNAGVANEQFLASLSEAGNWFRMAGPDAFDRVDQSVSLLGDKRAGAVLDWIWERNGRQGRTPNRSKQADTRVSWGQEPYSLLRKCADLGAEAAKAKREHAEQVKAAEQLGLEIMSQFEPQPWREPSVLANRPPAEKHSNMGSLMAGVLGKSVMDAGIKSQPTTEQRTNSMVESLSDPQHEDELRKIQTQAMLQDLLQNDEVLSGYEPDEVLNAYNEFAQLSPSAASQPAIVRPMLRRRMTQGAIEPFEAAELANVEKTLLQTKSPSLTQKESNVILRRSVLARK